MEPFEDRKRQTIERFLAYVSDSYAIHNNRRRNTSLLQTIHEHTGGGERDEAVMRRRPFRRRARYQPVHSNSVNLPWQGIILSRRDNGTQGLSRLVLNWFRAKSVRRVVVPNDIL